MDFGFGKAKHGPLVGLEPMILVGILDLLLVAAMPIVAICLYGDAVLWQRYVNQPVGYLVLWLVGNAAPVQFVHQQALNRCWTMLGSHLRRSPRTLTAPRAKAKLRQLGRLDPHYLATPFAGALHLCPEWMLGASNAALRFVLAGAGAIACLVFSAGLHVERLSANLTGEVDWLKFVGGNLSDMGKAELAPMFGRARLTFKPCESILGRTRSATKLSAPVCNPVGKDVHFLAAFKALGDNAGHPRLTLLRRSAPGGAFLAAILWYYIEIGNAAGKLLATVLAIRGVSWHNKIPPVRDSCIQSAGAGPLQVTGFSDWLARPFLSHSYYSANGVVVKCGAQP